MHKRVASALMEPTEEIEAEETSPTELVRLGLDLLLTALCIYVMWGYVKERPEVMAATERAAAWWHEVTTRQRRIKKMENETVFEAIQVVTDDARD